MTTHMTGTRKEWLAARLELLEAEKDLTRRSDEVAQRRQALPGASKGAVMTGTDVATYARDRMGLSAFALEDGIVYHTYSTYSRGVDALWGAYQWLDRAPKGRNETGYWWRQHDQYGKR